MMRLTFTSLLCCISVIFPFAHCFETPALEVVVVIKATTNLTDNDYFTHEVLPFLVELSNFLVFPEEISPGQPEFARISVNIGGDDEAWPDVSLRNYSRQSVVLVVQKLHLSDGNNTNNGNERAFESALQTYYSSSVALNRITVILTDEIDHADTQSLSVQSLQLISDAIFIVGIPSTVSPNFDESLKNAAIITQAENNVYSSIVAAANTSSGITSYIKAKMSSASRPCAGYIFAYDSLLDSTVTTGFTALTLIAAKQHLSNTNGFKISKVSTFVENKFVFLNLTKLGACESMQNDVVFTNTSQIYDALLRIKQRTRLTYFGIVLLMESKLESNTSVVSFTKTNLQNLSDVDLFTFTISNSMKNDASTKIIATKKIEETLKNSVLPAFMNNQCGHSTTVVPNDGTTLFSTSEVTSTVPIVATSFSTYAPTTSEASNCFKIVFLLYFFSLFFTL